MTHARQPTMVLIVTYAKGFDSDCLVLPYWMFSLSGIAAADVLQQGPCILVGFFVSLLDYRNVIELCLSNKSKDASLSFAGHYSLCEEPR